MTKIGKPIIGIVSKHFLHNSPRPDTYIRDEIKQAVFDNGAIAIGILPPKDEACNIGDSWNDNLSENEHSALFGQINFCDGIIFQGGKACDAYEMVAAKYCYEHDIPALGICCGQNVLVRALGGTTYRITNPEEHEQPTKEYVHSIKVDPSSRFYEIVGVEEMMVNSRHIKDIGEAPLLDKVAFCEDGYTDVAEARDKRFYLGVRFHPESLYKSDENMNKIFRYFIEVCKTRRD